MTDSIFLWVIAIALLWLAIQAMGSNVDISSFVADANRWLIHTRDDLDLPSVGQIFRDLNSAADATLRNLGSMIEGSSGR